MLKFGSTENERAAVSPWTIWSSREGSLCVVAGFAGNKWSGGKMEADAPIQGHTIELALKERETADSRLVIRSLQPWGSL